MIILTDSFDRIKSVLTDSKYQTVNSAPNFMLIRNIENETVATVFLIKNNSENTLARAIENDLENENIVTFFRNNSSYQGKVSDVQSLVSTKKQYKFSDKYLHQFDDTTIQNLGQFLELHRNGLEEIDKLAEDFVEVNHASPPITPEVKTKKAKGGFNAAKKSFNNLFNKSKEEKEKIAPPINTFTH